MRLRLIFALLLIQILASHTQAAFSPIFKKPSSRFATALLHQDLLKNKTSKIISQSWDQIKFNNKHVGWIRSPHLIRPIHLIKNFTLQEDTPIRTQPNWNINPHHTLKKQNIVQILKIKEDWIQISFNNQIGWTHLQPKLIKTDLKHFAIATRDSSLYNTPDLIHSSMSIEKSQKLEILEVYKDSLKVQLNTKIGFVPLKHFITLAHFAKNITFIGKMPGILPSTITRSFFKLKNGKKTLFRDVDEIEIQNNRAYIISNNAQTYQLPDVRSKKNSSLKKMALTFVTNQKTQRWGQFKSPTHGKTWWQFENKIILQPIPIPSSSFFTQNIRNIIHHSKVKDLSFASANGIFRTIDGKNWSRIKQFKNKSLPIAISKNGNIFIGHHMSKDLGETFKPFIRWEKVMRELVRLKYEKVTHLKIDRIKVLDNKGQKLKLYIDTGHNKVPVTYVRR